MIVLGLDTSTLITSVAITENGILKAESTLNSSMSHSESLVPMIDELFHKLNISINDIDLIAVTKGPGSFTGLRIGMTVAKTLAQVSNKSIVAVSTLEALAHKLWGQNCVVPMLDARRDRVFTAIYDLSAPKAKVILEPDAIEVEELVKVLKKFSSIYVNGDGVDVYKALLQEKLGDKLKLSPLSLRLPSAATVCEIGERLFLEGKVENFSSLTPDYLRKSRAERARE